MNGPEDRTAHVGYYLIGKGLPQLEHLIKIKNTLSSVCRKTDFPVSPVFLSGFNYFIDISLHLEPAGKSSQ